MICKHFQLSSPGSVPKTTLNLLSKQGIGNTRYSSAKSPSMLWKLGLENKFTVLHTLHITHKCSAIVNINGHTTWKVLYLKYFKRLMADSTFYLQMLNIFFHHSSTFSNWAAHQQLALNSSQPNYLSDLNCQQVREYFFAGKQL